jgi:glycosyltransferase involved in cell wall biosynthesis
MKIAVVIPVGPKKHHAEWLDECLLSVIQQTREPEFVVVVDDMHGLGQQLPDVGVETGLPVLIYEPPWLLGVGSAFNHGCAIAFNRGADLALMMGADDRLGPGLIAALEATWAREGGRDGYYWHDTHYQDGNQQHLPCNNASMTRGFLQETGGLPVEAAAGGMDAALMSAMLVHRPHYLIPVEGPDAYVWSRQHPNQERERLRQYDGVNGGVRNIITANYAPTEWGRYFS